MFLPANSQPVALPGPIGDVPNGFTGSACVTGQFEHLSSASNMAAFPCAVGYLISVSCVRIRSRLLPCARQLVNHSVVVEKARVWTRASVGF